MTSRFPGLRVRLAASLIPLAAPLPLLAQSPYPAPGYAAPTYPAIADADPVAALSRYLRMLAANPRDLASLTGAGRAALAVGDANAALGFYARAEEIAPRNGRIKAGLASALVQMEQPRTALKLFGEAVALGVPVADIASDRGLAHDLNGDGRSAQADYTLALRAKDDDETLRRLALSMAVSGDRAGALTMLAPLLRRRDSGAIRARAFVLALTGDQAGAASAVRTAMPGPQATVMANFMTRLAGLNPAQKALAVNFGYFPSDGRSYSAAELFADSRGRGGPVPVAAAPASPARASDTPLVPTGVPLGARIVTASSDTAPRRRPGQIDTPVEIEPPAHVLSAPIPGVTPRALTSARGARASAAPVAAGAASSATGRVTASSGTQPLVGAPLPAAGGGSVMASAAIPTTAPQGGVSSPMTAVAAPLTAPYTSATVRSPVPTVATAQPGMRVAGAAPTSAPAAPPIAGSTVAAAAPLGAVGSASVASVPGEAAALPQPGFSDGVTASGVPAAAGQARPVVTAAVSPSPVTAAALPQAAAPAPEAAQAISPATPPVPGALIVTPRGPMLAGSAAPRARTATRLSPVELAMRDPDAPRPATAASRRPEASETRAGARTARTDMSGKAAGAEKEKARTTDKSAKADKAATAGDHTGKPARGTAKADPKDKADPKGKADGRSKPDPKTAQADTKGKARTADSDKKDAKGKSAAKNADRDKSDTKAAAAKAKVPERYWVQVASGSNKANLDRAWGEVKGKAPKLLGGKTTYTAPWRASNRLLIGPFKSEDEAQAEVNKLAKAGVSGIQFTTRAGNDVEKVSAK